MRIAVSRHQLFFAVIVFWMVVVNSVAVFYIYSNLSAPQNNNFGFNVELKVAVDNKTIYDAPHDLLMAEAFEYIICKGFNDTDALGACFTSTNVAGLMNFFVGNTHDVAPQYFCAPLGSNTVVNNKFFSNEDCTMTAGWLSTDTSTPISSNPFCASALSTNGLGSISLTTSGHSIGSNQITLTGTWLASGAQSGIDKACIGLWNFKGNHAVDTSSGAGNPRILTADLFPSTSVSAGQTIQLSWIISF